jgi:hypothetical protein
VSSVSKIDFAFSYASLRIVWDELSWWASITKVSKGSHLPLCIFWKVQYQPLIWGLLVILDFETIDVPGLGILFRGLCGYQNLRHLDHSGATMRNRTWQPESPTTIPSCWRKKARSSIVFSLQRLQPDVRKFATDSNGVSQQEFGYANSSGCVGIEDNDCQYSTWADPEHVFYGKPACLGRMS